MSLSTAWTDTNLCNSTWYIYFDVYIMRIKQHGTIFWVLRFMRWSNTVGRFLIVLITFDRICSTHWIQRMIPYNLCLYNFQELDDKIFKKSHWWNEYIILYATKSIGSVIRDNVIGRCKYCKIIVKVIIST